MLLILAALGAALGAAAAVYSHAMTEKDVASNKHQTVLRCAAAGAAGWLVCGFTQDLLHALLFGALFSLLTAVFVIDWRIYEIPNPLNLAILALGAVQLMLDLGNWSLYVIGMFSVSLIFLLLWFLTRGAGIGMGDVKLMGAAGLLLGWPRTLLAMLLGSILGSVIHIVRMRFGASSRLAFGPYLAMGLMISAWFGSGMIAAYLGLFGL